MAENNKENPKTSKKELFVAYYRVSTKKQSQEMPAQKTAVKKYLGDRWPPVKSFKEQESGKTVHNRPELQKALDYCYEHDATLVVAKLDRLSRDLGFIGWLQTTEIKFVCCDMPAATRETIGFMGVMARWEREQISKRTKEALAEKKKRGIKLGAHRRKVRAGLERYRREQAKQKKLKAKALAKEQAKALPPPPEPKFTRVQQSDAKVIPAIKVMRGEHKSFQEIAEALNNEGIPSRFGGQWHKTSVLRVADRNGLE